MTPTSFEMESCWTPVFVHKYKKTLIKHERPTKHMGVKTNRTSFYAEIVAYKVFVKFIS